MSSSALTYLERRPYGACPNLSCAEYTLFEAESGWKDKHGGFRHRLKFELIIDTVDSDIDEVIYSC